MNPTLVLPIWPVGVPVHHVLALDGHVLLHGNHGIEALVVGRPVDIHAEGFAVAEKEWQLPQVGMSFRTVWLSGLVISRRRQ
jgi:hypothetical protein